MTVYEHPMNEKIRLFMRMNTLLERFDFHMQDLSKANSHAAIMVLMELYNLSSRLDVKSSMLNVLDWQTQALRGYSNISPEDTDRIERILNKLEDKSKQLYGFRGQLGQHLKAHNFLGILRQRAAISGGVNGLDIPLFNHWLSKPHLKRETDLKNWVKPYLIAREAIQLILKLIYGAYEEKVVVAEGGFYQETLSPHKEYQLLRLTLKNEDEFYPEISAGKQRLSIRFVDADNLEEKGKQILQDVEFKLTLCHL